MADMTKQNTTQPVGECCCGEPCTLGTVHRTDGPCFAYTQPADSGRVRAWTDSDKSRAFEWLRAVATADDAPDEAGIALDTWHALATAAALAAQGRGDPTWRECYGTILKALGAMANVRTLDEPTDRDVIPREPIMEQVCRIRWALDAANKAKLPASPAGVPDEMVVPYGSASGKHDYTYGYEKGTADGWNKCRLAVLTAAPSAPASPAGVPDGWVMVPREPTIEMLVAANAAWFIPDPSPFNKGDEARREVWKAMLTAAPSASQESQSNG